MRTTHALIAAALLLATVPACAQERADGEPTPREGAGLQDEAAWTTATYDIIDGEGATIGEVALADGSGGVLVKVRVEGLAPGLHGLHFHETGRCEPPDFASAGGHYAPGGNDHGFLVETGPHAGDLPNLWVADGEGETRGHAFADGLSIAELREGDGSAVMFHGGADDYRSQPSGAAGAQVACAAIPGG